MNKSNSLSYMNQLFKYFSPINKSNPVKIDNNEMNSYKTNNFQKVSITSFRTINGDEMQCQNYNLNGNYKAIYFYKDDDEENQLNKYNDNFDLNNFIFKGLGEEKIFNNKNNKNNKERELRNNNKKNINTISNTIKKNIRLKNKKNNTNKNKNDIKENKSNKNYIKKQRKENNEVKNENKSTIIKKKEIENNNNINDNNNVSFKVINLSTINNNSLVIITKKNDITSDDLKKEFIKKEYGNNTLKTINIKQNSEKDIDQKDLKNKRNKGKLIKSQSSGNLNLILDDYFKKKNKENNTENKNNLSINCATDKVKVTYSSSCDNKKIRTFSKGTKVTIFQHFNRTQKIIENTN